MSAAAPPTTLPPTPAHPPKIPAINHGSQVNDATIKSSRGARHQASEKPRLMRGKKLTTAANTVTVTNVVHSALPKCVRAGCIPKIMTIRHVQLNRLADI